MLWSASHWQPARPKSSRRGGLTARGIDHFARPGDEFAVAPGTDHLHRNFRGHAADSSYLSHSSATCRRVSLLFSASRMASLRNSVVHLAAFWVRLSGNSAGGSGQQLCSTTALFEKIYASWLIPWP